jgi:hypothetical protein
MALSLKALIAAKPANLLKLLLSIFSLLSPESVAGKPG